MTKSDSIKELAAALAKAFPEIDKADKERTNPHFRSKYADLGNVVDAIKPALCNHGLSFVQHCHQGENAAIVETVIIHSSGEWMSCGCISVPTIKADPQAYGSALTYARRYSLSAAFGVAPEDDDGNAAVKAPEAKKRQPSGLSPLDALRKELADFSPELNERKTLLAQATKSKGEDGKDKWMELEKLDTYTEKACGFALGKVRAYIDNMKKEKASA